MQDPTLKTGLKLRVTTERPAGEATVGLSYVQPGFKWVPQYRVRLGEDGRAQVTLQAALVNDLIDLEDAAVRLVVGVPTFAFAGMTDPISLQVAYDQLERSSRSRVRSDNGRLLMNSIQTQMAYDFGGEAPASGEAAPVEVAGGARAEDLYVYTLEHVTLARGERMTVTVAEFTVPYEDRYAALLPLVPPRELIENDDDRRRVGALLAESAVTHAVRLTNTTEAPFTTAPALLYRGPAGEETLLAQGLMTYAAPGGTSEVNLGTAVEVGVDLSETVTGRAPAPDLRGQERFERISLTGTLKVTNRRPEPTTVRVVKLVPGEVTAVSEPGGKRELGPADIAAYPEGLANLSPYGVPTWWASLNPTTEVVYELTIPPGETVPVTYDWGYFWRW